MEQASCFSSPVLLYLVSIMLGLIASHQPSGMGHQPAQPPGLGWRAWGLFWLNLFLFTAYRYCSATLCTFAPLLIPQKDLNIHMFFN